MSKHIGCVDICYIEEPFIFRVNGDFTLEVLETIENDLIKDEYGFNDKYKGKEEVRFSVDYIEKEELYGTGYGDIYTIPSYYDLTCVSEK